MKTDEQVFTEWVSDEIHFDAGTFGLQFTKSGFEEFCSMLRDGRRTGDPMFPELDRMIKTRNEAEKALMSCGWPEAQVHAWLTTFMEASNLVKFTGTDEVAATLRLKAVAERERMGWSATPYTI